MFSMLLEPLIKYIDAAATLATIRQVTPRDQPRIASAQRAANEALRELTTALTSADIYHISRDGENVEAVIQTIAARMTPDATSAALSDDRS